MSDSPPLDLPRGRAGRLKALQKKMKTQQKSRQLKEEQNELEITTATPISEPATQLASKVSRRDVWGGSKADLFGMFVMMLKKIFLTSKSRPGMV